MVGGLLILGITVIGMVGALFWGAPELEKLDERGAQVAMIGDFRDVRRDTLVLSLSDSARVPRIAVEKGQLDLVEGTRIQIGATFDGLADFDPSCAIHVTQLAVAGNADQFAVSAPGCDDIGTFAVSGDDGFSCATAPCLRVYKVTGSNLNAASAFVVSGPIGDDWVIRVEDGSPATAQDMLQHTWLFEVGPAATPPSRGAAWADIWSFRTLGLEWSMPGRTDVSVYYEAGAIFTSRNGAISLMDAPPMDEEAYLTQDFVWRLLTMSGSYDGITAPSNARMFVGLIGADQRTSRDDAVEVRMDFAGAFAQAWCNTMRLRSDDLQFGSYNEDPAFTCNAGDANGVRSIIYTTVDGGGSPTSFPFELFHARITTNL